MLRWCRIILLRSRRRNSRVGIEWKLGTAPDFLLLMNELNFNAELALEKSPPKDAMMKRFSLCSFLIQRWASFWHVRPCHFLAIFYLPKKKQQKQKKNWRVFHSPEPRIVWLRREHRRCGRELLRAVRMSVSRRGDPLINASICILRSILAPLPEWRMRDEKFSLLVSFCHGSKSPFSCLSSSLVLILTSCTSSPLVGVSTNYPSVLTAFRRN